MSDVQVTDNPGESRYEARVDGELAGFAAYQTADDLITGLNEVRPHVVHFSGHAGDASLLFDN